MDELSHTTVRFRVGDVVHPRPVQVLLELFQHLSLEGEVVTTTSDGDQPFLVVRVPGLSEAVIIAQKQTTPFYEREGTPLLASASVAG